MTNKFEKIEKKQELNYKMAWGEGVTLCRKTFWEDIVRLKEFRRQTC